MPSFLQLLLAEDLDLDAERLQLLRRRRELDRAEDVGGSLTRSRASIDAVGDRLARTAQAVRAAGRIRRAR